MFTPTASQFTNRLEMSFSTSVFGNVIGAINILTPNTTISSTMFFAAPSRPSDESPCNSLSTTPVRSLEDTHAYAAAACPSCQTSRTPHDG